MQFSTVPIDEAQRVMDGASTPWFSQLLAGDMLLCDRRPALSKKQSAVLIEDGLRMRTKSADERGFYVWFERIDIEPEDDFDPPYVPDESEEDSKAEF